MTTARRGDMTEHTYIYDVFISHSHADNRFCDRLYQALEQTKARVWYDRQNLQIGELTPEIEHALSNSHSLVVVLSPDALTSSWVEKEAHFFHKLPLVDGRVSHHILPVVARDIVDLSVWPFLDTSTYIWVRGEKNTALSSKQAILKTVRALGLTPTLAELVFESRHFSSATRRALRDDTIYLYPPDDTSELYVGWHNYVTPHKLEIGIVEIQPASGGKYIWRFMRAPKPQWQLATGRGLLQMHVSVNGQAVEPNDETVHVLQNNDRFTIKIYVLPNPRAVAHVEHLFGAAPAHFDAEELAHVTTVTFRTKRI